MAVVDIHPHICSREAEVAVIGSMLWDNECIVRVMELVSEEQFYYPENAKCFKAILLVRDRNEKIDVLCVNNELHKMGESQTGQYLEELFNEAWTAANVVYYAEIVKDKWLNCRMLDASKQLEALVCNDGSVAENIIKGKEVLANMESGQKNEVQLISAIIPDACDVYERGDIGLKTGYPALDFICCGLHGGDYILIAACTSIGKTTLGMNIAARMAKAGHGVLVVSLEMTPIQLVKRLMGSEAKVDVHAARQGRKFSGMCPEDLSSLFGRGGAGEKMMSWPLYIAKASALTVEGLRMIVRSHRKKIECVIVDYIGLMNGEGKTDNQRIGGISRGIKNLAQDEELPFLVMCQVNRDVSRRENKRLRLPDLRDSGCLEQDADQVWFLHREDYWHKEDKAYQPTNTAELSVAKNRDGPLGVVELMFHPKYVSFEELQPGYKGFEQR